MYLHLALTYPFSGYIFGFSLAIEWVSSWLLRTRVSDVNSFLTTLNSLLVKILMVLHLRAIWNKDLVGEIARYMNQWTRYIDFFKTLVTLILYFMTAGMFCKIWFLIDRDDWWSKLAEVLVGFRDSMILNPPTDCTFQSAMSVVTVDVYIESVSGIQVSPRSCWENETHFTDISNKVEGAFQYVF